MDPQQNSREQILQVWNLLKNSNNKEELMQNIMNQNPGFKKSVDSIMSMGNLEQLFYASAQKKGVDPNSILGLLK